MSDPVSITVTVTVMREDIDRGQRNNCKHCPVARALVRSLPAVRVTHPSACRIFANTVNVYQTTATATCALGGGVRALLHGTLPGEVVRFITHFDAIRIRPGMARRPRHEFEPFFFDLTLRG